MSATNRRRAPAGLAGEAVLIWTILGLLIGGLALLTAAVHLAVALDGSHEQLPAHPVTLLADLARGRLAWPRHTTLVLVGLALIVGALVTGLVLLWRRHGRGR